MTHGIVLLTTFYWWGTWGSKRFSYSFNIFSWSMGEAGVDLKSVDRPQPSSLVIQANVKSFCGIHLDSNGVFWSRSLLIAQTPQRPEGRALETVNLTTLFWFGLPRRYSATPTEKSDPSKIALKQRMSSVLLLLSTPRRNLELWTVVMFTTDKIRRLGGISPV